MCETIAVLSNDIIKEANKLARLIEKVTAMHDEIEQAKQYAYDVKSQMEALRSKVDFIETVASDNLWPFPRLWEMLFIS